MSTPPKIRPFLWFDDNAEEAMRFYVSIFPDSTITNVTEMFVAAILAGQPVMALNGGPIYQFSEAFSFFVDCADQAEVDRYWDLLRANGGEPGNCGWLKDRFGLSWQIIPRLLGELLSDDDEQKAGRVMAAMLEMKKLDCAALQRAYDAEPRPK